MSCELCETIDWKEGQTHRIVTCKTCNVKMLVLREHRQFTEFEKEMIYHTFAPWVDIRFEMRKIPEHGHCHFYDRK